MNKRVLLAIANGSEEIEAITVVDVLRRAGAEVTLASVELGREITASRGVRIVADCLIDECLGNSWDMIVLPGGMPGAERLRDSHSLKTLLLTQRQREGSYAAICAAPAVVLEPFGLLKGVAATAYPSFLDQISGQRVEAPVVSDRHCITSQGPATAMAFALKLVEHLAGGELAKKVADGLLYPS